MPRAPRKKKSTGKKFGASPKAGHELTGRPLSELKPGESATILKTPVDNERLAEIGFVAGEKVTLVRVAPLGDPVVIQVLDTPVIIRRAELAGVMVD